jgi:peptidoglycan/LPS O-acetylase OafA/YrhL
MTAGRSPRVPELDGLRGVAISLVMLTHFTRLDGSGAFDLPFLAAGTFGWAGVDLFFVLSGYLITQVLLERRGGFFRNRALRILPVYYLWLLFATFAAPRLFPPGNGLFPDTWVSEPVWHWAFLSNFLVVTLGRFPAEALSVAWSLAIEVQFYLVWPWLVWRLSELTLRRVAASALLFAFGLRVALVVKGWAGPALYAFTLTRLDGLAAGALVALWNRTPEGRARVSRWRGPACAAGVVVLSLLMTFDGWLLLEELDDRWLITISFSALALCFAGMLAYALDPASPLSRVFRVRWLRSLGIWSFPIFLTNHLLGYAFSQGIWDPATLQGSAARAAGQIAFYLVMFVLCGLIGALLHYTVERPFLRLKFQRGLQ